MRYSMTEDTTTICLKNISNVNCYLIKSGPGFILIDTGFTKCRVTLDERLEIAGCKPGNFRLILVTHGDFDHIGNCLHLRNKFNSKIAMHADDAGMAERGDMFWNRKKSNVFMKTLAKLLFKLDESDRFSPDITLNDGDDLTGYGLEATVVAIPGHSKGSIGILTKNGDLFCGDMFQNVRNPGLNSIMDDPVTAQSSLRKLDGLHIRNVYPGHGKMFAMKEIAGSQR
jgi:hydroxyacylglutathione hydrolase